MKPKYIYQNIDYWIFYYTFINDAGECVTSVENFYGHVRSFEDATMRLRNKYSDPSINVYDIDYRETVRRMLFDDYMKFSEEV